MTSAPRREPPKAARTPRSVKAQPKIPGDQNRPTRLCKAVASPSLNKLMCYPQQLGRSWKDFISHLHQNPPALHQPSAPGPSGISSAICTRTLRNFISHLHQNPPALHQPSAPGPSGISSAICTRTLRNFISLLRRNPPELHQPSAPEPSGISSAICTGTLRNLLCYLHRNPPEPCLLSAPDGTLWNFISFLHRNPPEPHHLHRNPPEPHQPSAPAHSGRSSAICTGTLRNLISHLHRNPPEPSGTLRNLLRNLGLQLHRIAPELFWAKDPIASFAVGEKGARWLRINFTAIQCYPKTSQCFCHKSRWHL